MNKKLNYFTTIKFLKPYIMKEKKGFFMFYVGWLIQTCIAVIIPILLGIMIDQIVYYQNITNFLRVSMVAMITSILSCGLYFFIYAQHQKLVKTYVSSIKMDTYSHLLHSNAEFLSGIDVGQTVQCVQHYTEQCMLFVIRNIVHTINQSLVCIVALVYIYIIDWRMGLFNTIAIPAAMLISSKFGKKIHGYEEKQRTEYGIYVSWLFEMLNGLKEIQLLCATKKIGTDFYQHNRKIYKNKNKISMLILSGENIIEFANLLIQIIQFGIVGYLAVNNKITIGSFTIIMNFYMLVKHQIFCLSQYYMNSPNRITSISKICEILQVPTEKTWTGDKELRINQGKIRYQNVSFAYKNEHKVFNNLNLEVQPGEKLAIVGKSGCGKSTLINLLIGLLKPLEGQVLIDNQSIDSFTLNSLRESIGVVSQKVVLFDGTIRSNLLIGNKAISEEKMISVCKQVGIYEFINSLPNKFDTEIGSSGQQLSGGQKQRIAIARIYIKDPKIIIFDEATSALDKGNEELIFGEWAEVLDKKTSLVITHRKSSVMLCDRVGIMREGVIEDIGEPNDIVNTNSHFASIFVSEEGKRDV